MTTNKYSMKTLLLVEDDENLNKGISLKLSKEGYRVLSAFDLAEAKHFWATEKIEMVISDITLPDGSGLEFGKLVREESEVYLIYLTALDRERDVMKGYDTGADDYITKPFSIKVLASKVNALMRRLSEKEISLLSSGDIEVSLKEMTVRKDSKNIVLSKTETLLLIYFLENAGQIVSKEQILERVWGTEALFIDENTVTVNVSRLKSKLSTEYISNVRGLGYIWNKEVIKK